MSGPRKPARICKKEPEHYDHYLYTGLDIAKLNLQLHLAGRVHDLPNTAIGHRRLRKLLASQPDGHVVCEATGGYERDVVAALHEACVPVSILNPARVRHFARATGQRAKTDHIDAAVLSAYGQALQPKPTAHHTELEQQLAELVRRRATPASRAAHSAGPLSIRLRQLRRDKWERENRSPRL